MESFLDIFMPLLFVLFMIFIFGGYHKNKSAQREKERERQEKEELDSSTSLK